jgi:hypothetical protein
MRRGRYPWGLLGFGLALLATSVGLLVHAQTTTTGAGVAVTTMAVGKGDRTTGPEDLAHEYLDFETARQLLLEMVDRSTDADLKAVKEALLKSAERGRGTRSGYDFSVGYAWQIDLENRRWNVLANRPDARGRISIAGGMLTFHGDFMKDRDGKWVARMTQRQLGYRGG